METQPHLDEVLSAHNPHNRDKNIKFFEDGHKYCILTDPDSTYTSVTTWIHEFFEHFDADEVIQKMMSGKGWKEGHKYWGKTPEEIKTMWSSNSSGAAAAAGTDLHFAIECFMNNKSLPPNYTHADLHAKYFIEKGLKEADQNPKEWQYFLNFINDHPHLKPFRTEWTVYDEDAKIAGSIDMIYENDDGTLSIYDWKRSKLITRINKFNKFAIHPQICHFPDSNFWHYSMQLNTYKAILERKYGKQVRELFLVRLHPDAEEKNYELIQLPILSKDIIELFTERETKISITNNSTNNSTTLKMN